MSKNKDSSDINKYIPKNKLLKSKFANGCFNKSIVVRAVNDSFISFKYKPMLINEFDISNFYEIVKKYHNSNNIIIDSRLEYVIIYSILSYNDYILIYDVYKNNVINVYQWCVNKFNLSTYILNEKVIKKICIAYIILIFYLKLPYNNSQLLKVIKNSEISNYIDADIFINYMGVQNCQSCNQDNIKLLYTKLYSLFNEIPTVIEPINIKNLNINEIFQTFVFMKNDSFMLVL